MAVIKANINAAITATTTCDIHPGGPTRDPDGGKIARLVPTESPLAGAEIAFFRIC